MCRAGWRGGALPAITIAAPDLPEDVLALLDHHLLDLAGTNGDPNAGDPIQHDQLRIEHDEGDVESVVYNRAIPLFRTDAEALRRVHQVRGESWHAPGYGSLRRLPRPV